MKLVLATAIAAMSFGTIASANTISFDDLTNNAIITELDVGGGITATVTAYLGATTDATVGQVRVFDTDPLGPNAFAEDSDLFANQTNAFDGGDVRDLGSALIIQEGNDSPDAAPDDNAGVGLMTFEFSAPITLLSLIYIDGEEGASVNTGLTELGSFGSGISGDNLFVILDFEGDTAAQNISEFSVLFNGSGAIGEFTIAPVPVPAGLPLLLTGFGAFAYMRRKKKNA